MKLIQHLNYASLRWLGAILLLLLSNYGSVQAQHNMGAGNLNSCSSTIFDSGGNGGDYSNSELITETYCPDVAGQCLRITFSSFATELGFDELTIYDGSSTSAPIIGTYSGTTSPGTVEATNGCLTFVFDSDGSVTDPGWEASLSCITCPTCSDGIQNGYEQGVDCGGPDCPVCPCSSYAVTNDEACCATPLTVNSGTSCATTTAGTILNATASYPANGCSGTADDDVWFEFTATSTSHYVDLLNVSGSTTDLYHSVYSGSCGSLGAEISCSDPNSSILTGLTPGATYYIRVYSWTSTGGQNTTFDVCVTSPPANDEPCNAASVTVNSDQNCTSTTAGSVLNATASSPANGCSGTADDDVWFEFTATNTSHYVDLLNVSGSTTDLYHSVYSGTCSTPGTEISCSDPNSSTLTGLTPGATYYIRVYTWTSTGGQNSTFDLCVSTPPPPPSNDEPCDAIVLTVNRDAVCDTITSSYTVGATSSQAGCTGTANDDVWFEFTALSPQHDIELSNASGTTDLVHEVFSGTCGSLTSVNCSDPNTSSYMNLTVGDTYYVRVYTYSSSGANRGFDICVSSPCGVSAAPDCSLNYGHSTISHNPVNYSTGTALSFSDDRFADNLSTIGFDFCFDGVTYSECLVSSNGYITFPGCYSSHGGNEVIPGGYSPYSISAAAPNSTDAPTNAIMVPWHDIDPSVSGTIRTETVGTTPNQVFIVKFDAVAMFSSSCNSLLFSGQVMLYETSNIIEMHITEKPVCSSWNDGAAILGLNNYDGTTAVVPSGYNYPTEWTVSSSASEAHRFTPSCSSCSALLPTELAVFDGEARASGNQLYWETVSEEDLSHFIIERSTDAHRFEMLGSVQATGGLSLAQTYAFLDEGNNTPLSYYRLRMVDEQGSASYSPIIAINRLEDGTASILNLYPNPTQNGSVTLELHGSARLERIRLMNYMGQEVSVPFVRQSNQQLNLNTSTLPQGTYALEVQLSNGSSMYKKLMVQ